MDPLGALIANEVKTTKQLLKQLNNDRLYFDTCKQKIATLETKANATEEDKKAAVDARNQAEVKYSATKSKIADMCDMISGRKTALLTHALLDYTKAQNTFFLDSHETVQSNCSELWKTIDEKGIQVEFKSSRSFCVDPDAKKPETEAPAEAQPGVDRPPSISADEDSDAPKPAEPEDRKSVV